MINLKNNRGAITLYILISLLFFIIAIVSVQAHLKTKEANVESEYQKIKASYEKDANEVYDYSTDVTILGLIKSGKSVKENTVLTDENEDYITIPANFNLSKKSPTLVTEGMIIEDSQDNQYVWIPVFENKGDRSEWGVDWSAVRTAEETFNNENSEENETAYYTAIQTALKTYTATYANSMYNDVWHEDEDYGYYDENDTEQSTLITYKDGNMTEEEYNILYHNMLKSIYKNGGFYIGRYEMGVAVVNSADEAKSCMRTEDDKEYASSEDNTTNEAPTIDEMALPISKIDAVPYNYITQPQAQMLARKLGEQSDYSNVETSIMFGVQWDAICVFIEKYDANNTAETKSEWLTSYDYSKLWGNYHSEIFSLDRGFCYYLGEWHDTRPSTATVFMCTTGATERNSSLNIYDLAGNISEYTLERYKYGTYHCIVRGGAYNNNSRASYRCTTSLFSNSYSSRTSFFIN